MFYIVFCYFIKRFYLITKNLPLSLRLQVKAYFLKKPFILALNNFFPEDVCPNLNNLLYALNLDLNRFGVLIPHSRIEGVFHLLFLVFLICNL